MAEQQTAGRGRLGNSFHSPPGGLYCSVVLRPRLSPTRAGLVGLAAGLASAEAVHEVTGLTPVLKWPNDLLLDGRKLSGLLAELEASSAHIDHLVLGLGLNVNVPEFPPELAATATSLQLALGRPYSVESVLAALLARLEARCSLVTTDPAALLAGWRAWPNLLGHTVTVAAPDGPWSGVAEDLADDGALLVRTARAELRRVLAADVHLQHQSPAAASSISRR